MVYEDVVFKKQLLGYTKIFTGSLNVSQDSNIIKAIK